MANSFLLYSSLSLVIVLTLASCDAPSDPRGTLRRVTDGRMNVGLIENPPFASTRGGIPRGVEVDLASKLARQLNADVVFKSSHESTLMRELEQGRFDLLIGGLSKEKAWEKFGTYTRPYFSERRYGGKAIQYAWVVRKGENGWLYLIERFLHENQAALTEFMTEGEDQ